MPEKILVVCDERHIARLIEVNLQMAGYNVTTAYSGVEALEKVAADKPGMIILDVMMPRLDGFETLKRLQADPKTRDIRVIMLAAKGQDGGVFRAWPSGGGSHLAGPLKPGEFLAFVKRIFDHRR